MNGDGDRTGESGGQPYGLAGGGGQAQAGAAPSPLGMVVFDRAELSAILTLYGRMVARGEWRDYSLDFLPQRAVFSVHRRTSDAPLYRIVKEPRLARRQGAYSVIAQGGAILRRGPELPRVLAVLEPKLRLVGA